LILAAFSEATATFTLAGRAGMDCMGTKSIVNPPVTDKHTIAASDEGTGRQAQPEKNHAHTPVTAHGLWRELQFFFFCRPIAPTRSQVFLHSLFFDGFDMSPP
jgi:hypothetical protein